ncbi:hypothetical protein [Magnetospirillum sp. 64-120]|uniref:hypothetical protein n=1 Tax=Magnetospirillum sp. 64-120 TaxID=1895778 RepID=UPI0025C09B6C|nr:hypothetical protein [Magnetospirillum sp. 64-120]
MRGVASCLFKGLGLAAILLGLVYAVSALSVDADASVQGFMLLVAGAGGLILFFGLGLLGVGALVGGNKRPDSGPSSALSPEERQLRDSQDFQNQGQG